jgi:hypothetical protein
MSKRSRYERGSDDAAGNDPAVAADADYAAADKVEVRGIDPADGTKFTVVDAGTIINGLYFPREEAPAGEAMTVYLPDAEAAELVRCGVALKNEDGSYVEPGEAPPEPPVEEGEEIPA